MKKIIIGLIMLGLAGAAQADLFTGTAEWSNTNNWDTGAVPTSSTDVDIAGASSDKTAHATVAAGYTADAHRIYLDGGNNTPTDSGGNLTVADTGILNGLLFRAYKSSRLFNYGTINLTGYMFFTGNKEVAYNYATGTINDDGYLKIQNEFNNAGTFNGTSLEGDGTLNLTGGTMTFGSQTFFGDGGTLNVSNDGQLIFEGQDYVANLQSLVDSQITGVTTDQIQLVGNDTILTIPEPVTIMLGLGALITMFIRRKLRT